MRKIATPQDLQAELHGIMAYVHATEKPDRQVVASQLRGLADRLAFQRTPFLLQTKAALKNLQKQSASAQAQVLSYMKSFSNEFEYWDDELKKLIEDELEGTKLTVSKIDSTLKALSNTIPNVAAIEKSKVNAKSLMADLAKAEAEAKSRIMDGPSAPFMSTGNPTAMISMTKDLLKDAMGTLDDVVPYLPDFQRLAKSFDQAVQGAELLVKTPKDKSKLEKLKKMSASLLRFNEKNDSAANFLEELNEAAIEALKLVR
jgi:hypothetical protein